MAKKVTDLTRGSPPATTTTTTKIRSTSRTSSTLPPSRPISSACSSALLLLPGANLTPAEATMMRKTSALNTALATVQPDRLRTIVKNLCLLSPTATQYVEHVLLASEEEEEEEAVKPKKRKRVSPALTAEREKRGKVRKDAEKGSGRGVRKGKYKPRYAMCIQCEREYDVTLNSRTSCTWHPGSREPDFDGGFWADHDEDCHGRISELEHEYPQGFEWTCCQELGDQEHGCQTDVHRDVVG